MSPRARRILLLLWLCFLARAGFHAVLLPLWEGFDEWAHVAYLQRLAAGEGLPFPGQTRISGEVQASLSLTPMPAVPLSTPHLTHEEYWRLPPEERSRLRARLLALPPALASREAADGELSYEVQQPPLYYALLAPVHRITNGLALPARVLVLRGASLLAASLLIPLAFAAFRRAGLTEPLALAAAAVACAMPSTVMAAARVGNDGLSMALSAALLWAAAGVGQDSKPVRPLALGALLGAGLLTKAYFLTAVPALACFYAWLWVRHPRNRRGLIRQAALSLAVAAAISSWWYGRNYRLTGTWSGLQQVAGAPEVRLGSLAGEVLHTDWSNFFRIAFNTHLWTGNWSFLQVRSWMYDVFLLMFLAAAAGLVLLLIRRKSAAGSGAGMAAAGLLVGWFWVGLMYHEWTFARLGLSSSAGWYTVAVVSSEVLLLVCGWSALVSAGKAGPCLGAAAGLFVLLDLYGATFVLAPFYTGLMHRAPSGRWEAFSLTQLTGGGWAGMLDRISGGTVPPVAVAAMWLLWIAASLALPLLAVRAARA